PKAFDQIRRQALARDTPNAVRPEVPPAHRRRRLVQRRGHPATTPERMWPVAPWRIRGSYFESCNCEAICPCRRIDGVSGGRSTHGECLGVLSWVIEQGNAGDVVLDGLAVALAT